MLIAGGFGPGISALPRLNTAELYDSTTGIFSSAGSMISDRAQHTATLLADGSVLIVGGWNGHAADAADDPPWDPLIAELFDPSSLNFTASARMGTTRIGHIAIPLTTGTLETVPPSLED